MTRCRKRLFFLNPVAALDSGNKGFAASLLGTIEIFGECGGNLGFLDDFFLLKSLLQSGHPRPVVLLLTVACHSWPSSQIHHTFSLKSAGKFLRFRPLFLVRCHSFRRSVFVINVSLLSVGVGLLQTGQPLPRFLLYIGACHSCPLIHIHHTFLPEPGVTFLGVKSPFREGCHSLASCGFIALRLYLSVALGIFFHLN